MPRRTKGIRPPRPSASILASENILRLHPAGAGREPCYEHIDRSRGTTMAVPDLPAFARLLGVNVLHRSPERTEAELPVRAELRSEEHTSELQSRPHLVCRLLL